MLTDKFCVALKKQGFNFASGVPCSILGGIIDYLSADTDITYIPATREDEAIGVATGAYLAGKKPLVLMQNSGLGNCINALTSLVFPYKVPLLLLISWRGFEGNDAPEHLIMGKIMPELLKALRIPTLILGDDIGYELLAVLPMAIILRRGVLG